MKKIVQRPTFQKYSFLFFSASIGGFLWEVFLFLLKEGTFRNRGFLYGPYLPVYGIGAILFYALFRRKPFLPLFFCCALTGTGVELAVGWFLHHVFHLRYWDYTGQFLNYNGYICLWSALGFGIAGAFWIGFAADFLWGLFQKIPPRIGRAVLTLLVLLFLVDCAAALIFPNAGAGITFASSV